MNQQETINGLEDDTAESYQKRDIINRQEIQNQFSDLQDQTRLNQQLSDVSLNQEEQHKLKQLELDRKSHNINFLPDDCAFLKPIPTVLNILKEPIVINVKNNNNEELASVFIPDILLSMKFNIIKLALHSNIKTLKIFIVEEFVEDGVLIDGLVIEDRVVDADKLLEYAFKIRFNDYSMKTSLFQVNFVMHLTFDTYNISLPLSIANSRSKYEFI